MFVYEYEDDSDDDDLYYGKLFVYSSVWYVIWLIIYLIVVIVVIKMNVSSLEILFDSMNVFVVFIGFLVVLLILSLEGLGVLKVVLNN